MHHHVTSMHGVVKDWALLPKLNVPFCCLAKDDKNEYRTLNREDNAVQMCIPGIESDHMCAVSIWQNQCVWQGAQCTVRAGMTKPILRPA